MQREKSNSQENERKQSEVASGLAVTHEQATDAYTEGTVDGKIDQRDRDINIPKKRYKTNE